MIKKYLNIAGIIISIVFFAAAIVLLHKELRGYQYQDIINSIRTASFSHICLACIFTVLSFYFMTLYEVFAFRSIDHPLPFKKIGFTSFIANAFSHVVGFAVVTGSLIRFRQYSAWGLSLVEIGNIMVVRSVSFWMGFFLVCGLLFTFNYKEVSAIPYLNLRTAVLIGIICLLLVIGYLIWNRYKRNIILKNITIKLPDVQFSLIQILLSAVDWFLLGCVLYVLMPHSMKASYAQFFTIFFVAQIGGFVSNVPGGLGVFELIIISYFSSQIPASDLLGSLVLYRFVYYLLPLCAAMLMLGAYEARILKGFTKRAVAYFGELAPAFISPVFSVSVFIAGSILLFSSATPTLPWRLTFLTHLLPLPFLELSHFTGSIIGMGLMILARGLYYRLNGSYILSLVLLGTGILASLMKGVDYEEAVFLSLVLIALIPSRRYFYRESSLIDEKFTVGWIAAISVVVASSIWLGLFSYKHVEYAHTLWWEFSFSADASRFLRGSVGAVSAALVFGLLKLFRPPAYVPLRPTEQELQKAFVVAQTFPYTYAQLACLGDKELLFNDKGDSFIMFSIEGRSWISMGDPVGPETGIGELLWNFVERCDQHNAWPIFYEISEKTIHYYLDMGINCVKLGEEARVSVDSFAIQDSAHKSLRHSVNRIEKDGYVFDVVQPYQDKMFYDSLQKVSDEWLRSRKTREKGFSLGFFNREYLRRHSIGIVQKEGIIAAFSNIWLGAEKEEFSVDLMRQVHDAPNGMMDYLFVQLLLWGKEQGFRWFNLGMAPLSGLENRPLAPLWNKIGTFVFRHGEHFYNFQGLRAYKEKFNPVWKPKYLASPGGLALARVFADLAVLVSGGVKGVIAR
ncbi:MAG: bifunctional lysylphosphatidylglycerol flippase/synthetase MprF [bacterium]